MARIGFVVVIGGILFAMGFLIYMYAENQTNFIQTVAGDTVTVGPVEYVITFEGTHQGSKEVKPEHTFVKIGILAKYLGNDKTMLSGGQFLLVEQNNKKHEPVYGEFSSKDLLVEQLEPKKTVEKTTQFDIPFDEEKQYKVFLRAHQSQSSSEIAQICILNCE